MQLSQLPHRSHIGFVCQLKAYPLEMKTESKPTLKLKLVQLWRYTGEGLHFPSPTSNRISLSAGFKFTSDICLLNQNCQNPSSLTQDPPHSRRLVHVCLLPEWPPMPCMIYRRRQPPGRAPHEHNHSLGAPSKSVQYGPFPWNYEQATVMELLGNKRLRDNETLTLALIAGPPQSALFWCNTELYTVRACRVDCNSQ